MLTLTSGHRAVPAAVRAGRVQRLARCTRLRTSAVDKLPCLQGLSARQEQAVRARAVQLVGGPGSGKTKVLRARVGQLLAEGVPSEEILVITPTGQAREEMHACLEALVGPSGRGVQVETFNTIAVSILRRYIQKLPGTYRQRSFTLIDVGDMLDMQLSATVRTGLCTGVPWTDAPKTDVKRVRKITKLLSAHKANLYPAHGNESATHEELRVHFEGLLKDAAAAVPSGTLFPKTTPVDAKMMADFFAICEDCSLVTVDELVGLCVTLLETSALVCQELQARYRNVLVDNVQDCNLQQFRFLQLLAAGSGTVLFAGDPNQSSDASRAKLLQQAVEDLGMETVRLPENFRSTQRIADAAQSIFATGERPQVQRGDGPDPLFVHAETDVEEAETMVKLIKELMYNGVQGHDIAILYPKHNIADTIEERLAQANIPYLRNGRTDPQHSEVVKDLSAYLRMVANPRDEPAMGRVRSSPACSLGEQSWAMVCKAACQGSTEDGACSAGQWLFGDIGGETVKPEVVQQILDAASRVPDRYLHASLRESLPRKPAVKGPPMSRWDEDLVYELEMRGRAVRSTMDALAAQGHFGPILEEDDLKVMGVRPSKLLLAELQALRNIFVCVRSEAGRATPARALATLQVVSGYRFSLQGRQAVESADTVLHAISRAPDSYLEKWGPPDSDGHRDEDAPEPELTFQALLQPGAGARGRSKLSSSAAFSEPGDSLAAFEDALASLKLVDEQRGNVLISATHAEAMDPEGKVTLLPADMSQGREWPVVLVTGLEQRAGKQPSSAAHQERQAKLLLYVAMTRAQDALMVFDSRKRTLNGKTFDYVPPPFLQALHRSSIKLPPAEDFDDVRSCPKVVVEDIVEELFYQGACSNRSTSLPGMIAAIEATDMLWYNAHM